MSIFEAFFPLGPGGNALLATAYISGPPNAILGLIPKDIDPSKLSSLVSFAIGGLLGDVFFHLLPHTFMGGENIDHPLDENGNHILVIDEFKNIVLGATIFFGFAVFIFLDKLMRIFTTNVHNHNHTHTHTHSHNHSQKDDEKIVQINSNNTNTDRTYNLRSRKLKTDNNENNELIYNKSKNNENKELIKKNDIEHVEIKPSAYLNMFADFTHNITDGLAIAASFYVSTSVGAVTTLAVFFHEIPHEIGDFALLINGGLTKYQAMGAQFVTAIGAFLGTLIGIFIHSFSNSFSFGFLSTSDSNLDNDKISGLWGTDLQPSDLVLPFTAGTFLYIGTVGAVPEILEVDSTSKISQLKKTLLHVVCMFIGAAMMFLVAASE